MLEPPLPDLNEYWKNSLCSILLCDCTSLLMLFENLLLARGANTRQLRTSFHKANLFTPSYSKFLQRLPSPRVGDALPIGNSGSAFEHRTCINSTAELLSLRTVALHAPCGQQPPTSNSRPLYSGEEHRILRTSIGYRGCAVPLLACMREFCDAESLISLNAMQLRSNDLDHM